MKHLIITLLLGLATSALAQTAADYYKQGEAALKAGKTDEAKAAYTAALKLEPNHGNAKFRLLSMRNLSANARIKVRQTQLSSIILPVVAFENLTLNESLEDLSALIKKESEDSFIPNFVVDDPTKALSASQVNFQLRNIPASVALKYILNQAKARSTWDAHVINIRPLNAASTKAAATEPATTEAKK